jgi:hypothetical protein
MEFSFQISSILPLDRDGFAVLDSTKLNPRGSFKTTPFYLQQYAPTKVDPAHEKLAQILDEMGNASSKVYSKSTNGKIYRPKALKLSSPIISNS